MTTMLDFAQKIVSLGGRAYLVGGCVRDEIMGGTPHDHDYVVVGVSEKSLLSVFPEAQKVGNGFPVFLIEIEGERCEVALARKERKTDVGHSGFEVMFSSDTTLEEDLARRDLTINAMAKDVLTDEIIDPYGGQKDIDNKLIRATTKHFGEDPVRALRAARFAAKFGFDIEPRTVGAMHSCREELKGEPKERIIEEMRKAFKTMHPARFFRELKRADVLDIVFSQLARLSETDWNVSMKLLATARKKNVSETALFCCVASHMTKDALSAWASEMPLLAVWYKVAVFVNKNHWGTTAAQIVREIEEAKRLPLSMEGLKEVFLSIGRIVPSWIENPRILKAYTEVHGSAPKELEGWEIRKWMRTQQAKRIEKIL